MKDGLIEKLSCNWCSVALSDADENWFYDEDGHETCSHCATDLDARPDSDDTEILDLVELLKRAGR